MKNFMKNESGRKGIIIFYKMREHFGKLTDAQLGALIRALLEYSESAVIPEIDDPKVDMLFSVMKQYDDDDRKRYEKIVETKREAGKRGAEKRWSMAL